MRAMTINLSANSPIVYCLEDGTVLQVVETHTVPDVEVNDDGKTVTLGPPRLVIALRPTPRPDTPEPSVNGAPHSPPEPVPEKKAGSKMKGTGW